MPSLPHGSALAFPGYVADLLAWILHPCRAESGRCFWRRNGGWGYGTPNPANSPGEVDSILATDTRTREANVCLRLQILPTPFLLPQFLKAPNSHLCHPRLPLLTLPPPFPKALGSGSSPSLLRSRSSAPFLSVPNPGKRVSRTLTLKMWELCLRSLALPDTLQIPWLPKIVIEGDSLRWNL